MVPGCGWWVYGGRERAFGFVVLASLLFSGCARASFVPAGVGYQPPSVRPLCRSGLTMASRGMRCMAPPRKPQACIPYDVKPSLCRCAGGGRGDRYAPEKLERRFRGQSALIPTTTMDGNILIPPFYCCYWYYSTAHDICLADPPRRHATGAMPVGRILATRTVGPEGKDPPCKRNGVYCRLGYFFVFSAVFVTIKKNSHTWEVPPLSAHDKKQQRHHYHHRQHPPSAPTRLSSVGLERTSSLISSRVPPSSFRKNARVGLKFDFTEHPNSCGHVCAKARDAQQNDKMGQGRDAV